MCGGAYKINVPPGFVSLTDGIFYIPSSKAPLSAEVYLINTNSGCWIYDVGSNEESNAALSKIPKKRVVISHFHQDHAGNIRNITFKELYCGAFTAKKYGLGQIVSEDIYIDGVHIFPVPSSHAKGCVGLEYGSFALLGDSLYSASFKDGTGYNAGVLKETITALEKLTAKYFILSHDPVPRPAEEEIIKLKKIYSLRKKDSFFIAV